MNTWLAPLVALVPQLSSAPGTVGGEPPEDLELSSIAVTDGIVGGIIGPRPRVLLAASYDRVGRCFRGVRRRGGPEGFEVWVSELEASQFRGLLELALASGLPGLPLENPPSCMDVYGQGRQIRLDYGEVRWANGAPGGCRQGGSTVMPSEDDRRLFGEVVERLERAVDELPLRRGNEVDLRLIPFLADKRALDTYRRVMEHVLESPLRHRLDLSRGEAWDGRATFCWRGRATGEALGDVHFVIDRSGAIVRAPSPNERFDRFVPVETGMTLTEVLQRLGPPDAREQRADGSLIVTYLGRPPEHGGLHVLAPARLRFEDERLSAP